MQTKTVKILVHTCLLLSIMLHISGTSQGAVSSKHRSKANIVSHNHSSGTTQRPVSIVPDRGTEKNSRKYSSELDCLAAVIYHEARGESYQGKYAVADVTMNRVENPDYPKSVCAVVSEAGQYSWYSKKKGLKIPSKKKAQEAWDDSKEVAAKAMERRNLAVSKNVLYCHAKRARPSWAKKKIRVANIGGHIYYSERRKKS